MAGNAGELEKRAVDPDDEPSADWGWHASFYKAKIVAGVLGIIGLIVIMFGPYQSRTQDLWLIGIGLLLAFMIWRTVVNHRNAWRR